MHEMFEDASFVYLVMDLHEGGTLNELLEISKSTFKRLNEKIALTIIEQVLLALDFIHKRGIIHRDIKLDNILINSISEDPQDIEVVISDLGVA